MNDPLPDPGGRPGVWVVDDSPLEATVARQALDDTYDVLVLNDGSAALERLSSAPPPDCLVLDWQMPGVSGIEVCQFLRANPSMQSLPVLMLTAQHQTSDLVEALAAGADDYVAKPFVGAELAARVSALIRVNRLRERAVHAETQLRKLVESLPDALVTIDAKGNLAMVNAAARAMLASITSEPLGASVSALIPDFPLAAIVAGSREEQALPDFKIGDRVFAPVVRHLTSDFEGTTVSMRDVTDRRRADTRRLDFYSIIAHDLRAPLGVVTLKTDLFLRGRYGALSAEASRELDGMKSRIRDLLAMVDDFLDLARLEGTTLRIDPMPIDLGALTRDIVDDFGHVAEAKGVRMTFESCEAAVVGGDRRRLQQVVTNLLSNAIKFSDDRGQVTVRIQRRESRIETEITDTGRGIAPAVLPTLFQRYSRALDTAHKVAGTGLGLMIVREIVEAHGGQVSVRSSPGAGSTFGFWLPTV